MPSEIMQALYEGRRADAETLAGSQDLDVFEAAGLGDHRWLAQLLRDDGDLARAWSDDGFTALHYACFFGTPDCTITLLDAGRSWTSPAATTWACAPSTPPPPASRPSTTSAC